MIKSVPPSALLALLLLGSCSDPENDGAEPVQLGVQLSFLESEGCAELPAGALPAGAATVQLSLFLNNGTGEPLQELTLQVDPAARCQDDQGRSFACPFDADADGLRERYFAFDAQPLSADVVLLVAVMDEAGAIRWTGRSDPVHPAASGATVLAVTLRPMGAGCP